VLGLRLEQLSANQVAEYVEINLSNAYRQYADCIRQNNVCGQTIVLSFEVPTELHRLLDLLKVENAHRIALTALLKKYFNISAPNSLPIVNSTIPTSAICGIHFGDRITSTPREIMSKLLAIHGIHVDPSDFTTSIISLRQSINNAHVTFSPKYDCFISYRKDSDIDLARVIYFALKSEGVKAFIDFHCLAPGENWKDGFLKGLMQSRCFVPLISSSGLKCVRDIHADHSVDNLLLEFETALKVSTSQ
jgi:hypothetical protein